MSNSFLLDITQTLKQCNFNVTYGEGSSETAYTLLTAILNHQQQEELTRPNVDTCKREMLAILRN